MATPIISLRKEKNTVQLLDFGSTCHRLIRAAFMASPAVEWGVGPDGCWGSSFLCRPDETIFPFGALALALWPLGICWFWLLQAAESQAEGGSRQELEAGRCGRAQGTWTRTGSGAAAGASRPGVWLVGFGSAGLARRRW